MTAYADWTFYSGTFLGTAITEAAFPALALRASAVIDEITFGRAATEVTYLTNVKNAMCAVAEELQRQDAASSVDGIASESQGRYSVSYLKTSERSKSNKQKQLDSARTYLANTFLLFAGFNAGEYGAETADDS